jgi:hypothetical protein
MFLSEVFDQLRYGELSAVALANSDGDGIREEDQARLIAHINLGLTDLHTRFFLKEGEERIVLDPLRTVYTLVTQDVLKIERIFSTDKSELGFNQQRDVYVLSRDNIRAVNHNTFSVSSEMLVDGDQAAETELTVVYRANHPTIVKALGYFDPTSVVVDLPYTHLEALLLYIASRVMNPVGMSQQFHDGNNYAAKYEAACQRLLDNNYRIDQATENTRLQRNGWV